MSHKSKLRPRPRRERTQERTAEKVFCSRCGSTKRTGYFGVTRQAYTGIDPQGRTFTHIVRRRCRCEGCGLQRIERSLECLPSQEIATSPPAKTPEVADAVEYIDGPSAIGPGAVGDISDAKQPADPEGEEYDDEEYFEYDDPEEV